MNDQTSGAPVAEMPQDLGASETVAEAPKPNAEEKPKPEAAEQETPPSTEEPAEADVSDDEDAETEGDGQKRPSRNQRLKRKLAAFATELDRLASENERLLRERQAPPQPQQQQAQKTEAPKESDFPNDYFAYLEAKAVWAADQKAEEKVRSILEQQQRSQNDAAKNAQRQEASAVFRERVDEIREHIPDFDKVVSSAKVDIRNEDVLDMIRESEKGPLLAFHLASKPERIHELNGMSSLEAARFIGRLEARLSLPTPKTKTQAPPPVTPPKGGAAPAKSFRDLADSDDITAYAKHRDASRKRA